MARHHMTPDGPVPFTPEEETARDAEEAQYLADKPMNDWLASMASADSTMMPRWAEDIISKVGTTGMAPETVQKYNDKQALRGQKP